MFKTAKWSILLGWAVIQTNIAGFTVEPTCALLLLIDLSLSKQTPSCGDVHSITGQIIRSQMLRRCSLLATVMIINGGWHRSCGC